MKEIKFRAWQPKFKAWVYGIFPWVYGKENANSLNMHEFWRRLSENSLEKVCRFTGLKDKNGVEIYEGDIVTMHTEWSGGYYDDDVGGEHENRGVVAIVPSKGVVINKCMERDIIECDVEWKKTWPVIVRGYRSEVIGNIHQHAHLIKGEE